MGTALGLTAQDDETVAWFGNGVLARGTRAEAVAALRTAANAFVLRPGRTPVTGVTPAGW